MPFGYGYGYGYGFTGDIGSIPPPAIIDLTITPDPLNFDYDSTLSAPSAIADFQASDTEIGQVTTTWSNATGIPTPIYNIYRDSTLLASNVTSPYVDTTAVDEQVYTYRVDAINSQGTTPSNNDFGMSDVAAGGTNIISSLDSSIYEGGGSTSTISVTSNSEPFGFNVATTGGTDSYSPWHQIFLTPPETDRYDLSFDVVINSGTPVLRTTDIGGATETLAQTITSGSNTINVPSTAGGESKCYMYWDGRTAFDAEFTNVRLIKAV